MVHKITQTVWFLLIGWWLGPLWFLLACLIMCTFIGWPLAYWMFNQLKLVTLLEDVD